jgi:hypothetical protein
MYNTLGVGITLIIFTIILLAMAILFTIKHEYFDKYLSFMNLGLYKEYSEKGDEFLREKRTINIVSYYLISVIMGYFGYSQMELMDRIDNKPIFNFGEFITFVLVVWVAMIIINYRYILKAKKSKTANKELGWDNIIGIVFLILLIVFIRFDILQL